MTTLKEDLTALRTLLEEPRRWIKGQYARNEVGEQVISTAYTACAWCLSGALTKVVAEAVRGNVYNSREFDEKWLAVEDVLLRQTTAPNLVTFNDTPITTHEDVLRLLDGALETVS